MLLQIFILRVNLDPECLLNFDTNLKGIDRIKAKALSKQRLIKINLIRLDVLKIQRLNDQISNLIL